MKLTYDKLLSTFAFNCNLRPSNLVARFDVNDNTVDAEEEVIPCYLLDREDLLMRLRTVALGRACLRVYV